MEGLIGSTALSLSILPGNHALNRFVLSFIFFFFDILSKQKPVYIRTHTLWTGTLNSEHNQALSSVELTFSDFFFFEEWWNSGYHKIRVTYQESSDS